MPERIEALEARIDNLEGEVRRLREAVARLQPGEAPVPQIAPAQAAVQTPAEDASEEILTWVGRSSLLPRLATLSFLLVVALILRTVTDNGIVGKQFGSFLGMGYATLLIAVGWWKYRRESSLAPVFAICGGLLMFTIVVELQARFHALSSMPAYCILILTGVGLAVISYLYQVAPPVLVGSLGMCLAGVMIDYPNPFFPSLAILLLLANLLGAFATRLQRCSWLRWILLLVTATVIQVWGFKLVRELHRGGQKLTAVSPEWFLPMIFLLSAAFLGMAVLAVFATLRGTADRISRFDLALPTITAAWGHLVAGQVIRARWGGDLLLGWIGIFAAAALLGFAVWLARRKSPGVDAFAVAGTVLAILALPAAMGSLLAALPLVVLFALILAVYSERWTDGILRLLSYFVQLYACVTLVILLKEGEGEPVYLGGVVVAGLLAAAALAHFRWCRQHPPAQEMLFFSRLDRHDGMAILLFMAALVNGFFLLRTVLHHALVVAGGDILPAFQGGQSILINIAAAALLWISFRRRNREIRNVAILVTMVAGLKVFLFDLFAFRGVPLVLAVFSFGLTVSLLSICLARWQRPDQRQGSAESAAPERKAARG